MNQTPVKAINKSSDKPDHVDFIILKFICEFLRTIIVGESETFAKKFNKNLQHVQLKQCERLEQRLGVECRKASSKYKNIKGGNNK